MINLTKKTLLTRKVYLQILLILSLLGFLILTFFVKSENYFVLDLEISNFIQSIKIPLVNELMLVLTNIGYFPINIFLLSIPTTILFLKRLLKEAFLLVFSVGGVYIISQTIKTLVDRIRPSPELIDRSTVYLRHDSFPSGHVLFYIAFLGFLLFLIYTKFKNKVLVTFFSVTFSIMVIMIGVSRIYLGDHWFSDVLGAYLLGFIWLNIIIYIFQILPEKI